MCEVRERRMVLGDAIKVWPANAIMRTFWIFTRLAFNVASGTERILAEINRRIMTFLCNFRPVDKGVHSTLPIANVEREENRLIDTWRLNAKAIILKSRRGKCANVDNLVIGIVTNLRNTNQLTHFRAIALAAYTPYNKHQIIIIHSRTR